MPQKSLSQPRARSHRLHRQNSRQKYFIKITESSFFFPPFYKRGARQGTHTQVPDVQTSQRLFKEAPLPRQQMTQEMNDRPSVKIKGSDLPKRTRKSCWERPWEQLLALFRADERAVIARDASSSSSAADGDRSAGLGAASACKLVDFISVTGQFTPPLMTAGRFFQRKT